MTRRDDPRYHSRRWSKRRATANALTRDRCVRCLAPAFNVHHAYYGIRVLFIPLPIAGCEIPLWQIFPLCIDCHQGHAHLFEHYRVSKLSSWLNRNTWGYIWHLRFCALLALFYLWMLPSLLLLGFIALLVVLLLQI